MPQITPPQADALARLLLTLRPDWSIGFTTEAVRNMRRIDTDTERIIRVAVRGALTAKIRKPDVLAMTGEHWKAQADNPPEPPHETGRCPSCHGLHAEAAPCFPQMLGKTTDYATRAKAAIRDYHRKGTP